MGGVIVPLFNQRFDFGFLAAGTTQSVVMNGAINSSLFNRVQLLVRVHERSMSATQFFRFSLYSTLPSRTDPREFTESSALGTVDVTSTSPSSAPGLASVSLTDPHAFLKIVLTASQDSSGTARFYAEMSAVLVLKEY